MSSKKVIFLDIDGVLTSGRTHIGTREVDGPSYAWAQFDPVAVCFLNYICREFNYSVVISSTWREVFDYKTLATILTGNGCRFKLHSAWKTPTNLAPRGEQVREWLKNNNTNHYIIIDDVPDFFEEQFPFYVQTATHDGMLEKHMLQIKKLAISQRDKERAAKPKERTTSKPK